MGLGEPAYRGAQLYHALYVERIFEIASMSTLPAALAITGERGACDVAGHPATVCVEDGSVRYLFALPVGEDGPRLAPLRSKRYSCPAKAGRRFAFRRRPDARWIANSV